MKNSRQAAVNRSMIERAVFPTELHQIDARQIAGGVIQEHVFRAWITGIDSSGLRARVPPIDRRVVLQTGIAAVPRTFGHSLQQFMGRITRAGDRRIGDPVRVPGQLLLGSLHELVGYADRQIGVLEENRRIRLAIEVRLVAALFNQAVGFPFLFVLAFDEFQNVWMPDLQRLHLGGAPCLATRFHDGGDLVVDRHA